MACGAHSGFPDFSDRYRTFTPKPHFMLKLLTLAILAFFIYRLYKKSNLDKPDQAAGTQSRGSGDDTDYIDYEEVD
jgi:hypothetical protein